MKKKITKIFKLTHEILGYCVSLVIIAKIIIYMLFIFLVMSMIITDEQKGSKEIKISNVEKLLKKAKILKRIKKLKLIDGYKPGWSIDIDNEQFGWYYLTFKTIEDFPNKNLLKNKSWIELKKESKLETNTFQALGRALSFFSRKLLAGNHHPSNYPINTKGREFPNRKNLYKDEYYIFIYKYNEDRGKIMFLSKKKKNIFYLSYPTW